MTNSSKEKTMPFIDQDAVQMQRLGTSTHDPPDRMAVRATLLAGGRPRRGVIGHQPQSASELTPVDLHRRFWAAHGVQVVEQDGTDAISPGAALYLLVPHGHCVLFGPDVLPRMERSSKRIRLLLLRDEHGNGYRERAIADSDGRFIRFERQYQRQRAQTMLLGITADPAVATRWCRLPAGRTALRFLGMAAARSWLQAIPVHGRIFGAEGDDANDFLHALAMTWDQHWPAIPRACRKRQPVAADPEAGHRLPTPLVGPFAIAGAQRAPRVGIRVSGKRLFDVVFSLFALAITLPLYPLIALAILLEDGWPLVFVQRRETVGGREFPCLKFRSMRKDAEAKKASLKSANLSDGPQFHMNHDPRVLRVGRCLRASKLDELPQLLNVLLGHMSVVGPRPSPFKENQYCPVWREARLSVRPGITGLWQVMRTRRPGCDFQEWIQYDLEYVRTACWRLDLWILLKTLPVVILGK